MRVLVLWTIDMKRLRVGVAGVGGIGQVSHLTILANLSRVRGIKLAAFCDTDPKRIRCPYADGMRSLAAVLAAVRSAQRGGIAIDLTKEPCAVD